METLLAAPPEIDRHHRLYNDTATWLAEVLDGSMRTPFSYRFDGHELFAEDGGALGKVFHDALIDAETLPPELSFEANRRRHELDEYRAMVGMMRGELPNTMVVVSDFPPQLDRARADVGGYNVTRRQAMLRVIVRDGSQLHMFSQTLDGSDRSALEAIYTELGASAQPGELLGQRLHADLPRSQQLGLTDQLTAAYDRQLTAQCGGLWQAGRREVAGDTYEFVLGQHQLIENYVAKQLAGVDNAEDRYNLAALLNKRFEAAKHLPASYEIEPAEFILRMQTRPMEWELQQAGSEARASGKVFSGCGMSSTSSAEGQASELGYGNQSTAGEDKYGSLTFKCKNGHTNVRPHGKLISHCWVKSCKNSVAC